MVDRERRGRRESGDDMQQRVRAGFEPKQLWQGLSLDEGYGLYRGGPIHQHFRQASLNFSINVNSYYQGLNQKGYVRDELVSGPRVQTILSILFICFLTPQICFLRHCDQDTYKVEYFSDEK